ncbi:MAG: hypothetical protein LBM59_00350 [Ruminococcus sp.]|jgi:hypothetical protein|nr:hypothetical protein [Ruminococcus sp.]
MKLKKLFAALVAGVIALTMAPIAASAAVTPETLLSSVTIGGAAVTLNQASTDGSALTPFTGSVTVPYSTVNAGNIILRYTQPPLATVTIGTSTSALSTSFTNGSVIDSLLPNKVSDATNVFYIRVQNSGVDNYYAISVRNGTAPTNTVTFLGGGVGLQGGAAMNVNDIYGQYNNPISAVAGDRIRLQVPTGTNVNGKAFASWKFSPALTPWTGGAAVSTSVAGGFEFRMPASSVSITAIFTDGTTYNGTGGSSTGTTGPNAQGQYYLTLRGATTSSRWVDPYSTVYIYPLTTTGFSYWIAPSSVTLGALYTQASNSFVMPRSDVTISANNYNSTGTYTVTVYGGTQSPSKSYYNVGERVDIYSSYISTYGYDRWYSNQSNTSTFLQNGIYSASNWFYMPAGNVILSYRESDIDYNTGTNLITVRTNGVGSASSDYNYVADGRTVRLSATTSYTGTSTSPGYYYNDPYYLLYGTGGTYGYNYGYTYAFSGWSISGSYTYNSGYSSTSNPTYVTVYSDITATANFSTTAVTPITPITPTVPTTPSTNTNANTYTNNGATATINTSTGVITAGVNSSGTLNSAATSSAVSSAVKRGLTDSNVTVNVPTAATAISKSAMQKLLTAAGSKNLRIQLQSTYGTILLPVSSARQIMTKVSTNSTAITNAIAKFRKAYGNTDIVGIQTSQSGSYGVSATYRISADAIGLGADYGDKVYIAIYNPTKGTFQRKTVTINAKGEIAFASSASGVILFSSYPFAK